MPKESVNFQEQKFGHTIGHFAFMFSNLKAIRLLLDKGLNPNIINKDGVAIIIKINDTNYSRLTEGLETLNYMIKKGGDVNLYSPNAQLKTPLIAAATSNFENVKVLIAAGANPHFAVDSSASAFVSPLAAALARKRINVVNYLVIDQKVDFRLLKFPMSSKFHPGDYVILYDLREMYFDLNTEDYRDKMKLIAYLKAKGLEY